MHKIAYGIIGYRNHSKKLLDILKKNTKTKTLVYVYKKNNILKNTKLIKYTNNLDDLDSCKAIIIASPSNTHFKYLKYFSNKNKYIFCEKPGVISNKELVNLKKFNKSKKELIYFNFNYQYSNIIQPFQKALNNKKYGELLFIYIQSSHGLYFKNSNLKKNSFKKSNLYENIYGNLGVHYISLLLTLFKKVKIDNISLSAFNKNKHIDTANVSITINNKIKVNLFLSYSTIYTQKLCMFFNNASIEYENSKIFEFYPRDTFSKDGNFMKPPRIQIRNNIHLTKSTNENSLKYFIEKVSKNKKFELSKFNHMLKVNELLIDSSRKINF